MILSIETSTPVCSVALHDGGKLISHTALYQEKSHAGLLAVCIDQLLKNAGLTTGALKAVAVSKGPGSYTGLRIGTSTAKGICFAEDIPLIATDTLEAMALEVAEKVGNTLSEDSNSILCPMLDARRMEVYASIYNLNMEKSKAVDAIIIEENSFEDLIMKTDNFFYFGYGAEKCQTVLNKEKGFRFIPGIDPSAVYLGKVANGLYEKGEFADLAYFEPFYLKEFLTKKSTKNLLG
ncbi:MAG: tRNA (adenosine(37)-N6)-threonylcarbamoyltransferase complex dimerization subunit type 1 TsaB [Flammeovirgaceae bacterium]|nr:tRNA (adenosine(37)-N6)-threonylcarbamoyltransferase complex dimerization subunit type 1 TsaB [Flammeovirgaceae bacterium]